MFQFVAMSIRDCQHTKLNLVLVGASATQEIWLYRQIP